MLSHIAAMGQHQRIFHNLENISRPPGIYYYLFVFYSETNLSSECQDARIFLIKILIFDTGVRGYDYSDKYSYYELQWELY